MKIYLDCTDTHFSRSNTGIQRVVRNFVTHAVRIGPSLGVECVPVVLEGGKFTPIAAVSGPAPEGLPMILRRRLNEFYFRCIQALARAIPFPSVRHFLLAPRRERGLARILYSPIALLQLPLRLITTERDASTDDVAELNISPGDIIFLPDASWCTESLEVLHALRGRGARVVAFLHDIIPITHPEMCNPSHVTRFQAWFDAMLPVTDAILCNSRFTLESLQAYCAKADLGVRRAATVAYLGNDLAIPASSEIRHRKLGKVLEDVQPVFLCVGTLDSRKNQSTLLDAFDRLWSAGASYRLLIIGRAGWLSENLTARIRRHPLVNRQLWWFDNVDDDDLVLAYQKVSALVFPSLIEGFGLPLVEALSHGTPVIASDIRVFREIGGSNVHYFEATDAVALAAAISRLASDGQLPRLGGGSSFRWPSWEESTRGMLEKLLSVAQRRDAEVSAPASYSAPIVSA